MPELVGAPHHFGGADAGIHADDQLHALFGGGLHYFGPHAVAVFQTVRHVIRGDAAGQFDGLGEQHDDGGAVHVVIAVDQDRSRSRMARAMRSTAAGMSRMVSGSCSSSKAGCEKAAGCRRGRRTRDVRVLWRPPVRFAGRRTKQRRRCGVGRGQHPARAAD